jgi:hypothetical protein
MKPSRGGTICHTAGKIHATRSRTTRTPEKDAARRARLKAVPPGATWLRAATRMAPKPL